MQDLYAILELESTASAAELKAAYRKLSKRYHPDIQGDNPFYVEKIKELNLAYDILSDPDKRSTYDYLRANSTASSTTNPTQPSSPTYTYTEDDEGEDNPFTVIPYRVRQFLGAVLVLLFIYLGYVLFTTPKYNAPKSLKFKKYIGIHPETGDSIFEQKLVTVKGLSDEEAKRYMESEMLSVKNYFTPINEMTKDEIKTWLLDALYAAAFKSDKLTKDSVKIAYSDFSYALENDSLTINYLINDTFTDNVSIPIEAIDSLSGSRGLIRFHTKEKILKVYNPENGKQQLQDVFELEINPNIAPGMLKKTGEAITQLRRKL